MRDTDIMLCYMATSIYAAKLSNGIVICPADAAEQASALLEQVQAKVQEKAKQEAAR